MKQAGSLIRWRLVLFLPLPCPFDVDGALPGAEFFGHAAVLVVHDGVQVTDLFGGGTEAPMKGRIKKEELRNARGKKQALGCDIVLGSGFSWRFGAGFSGWAPRCQEQFSQRSLVMGGRSAGSKSVVTDAATEAARLRQPPLPR